MPDVCLVLALYANTTASVYPKILSGEWVTVNAVGLSCVGGRDCDTTKHIDLARDGLKVGWIHTGRIATQVVEIEAIRNGPNRVLVKPSMGADVRATREAEPTISRHFPRLPLPALSVGPCFNLDKESSSDR
jgi:hypothetical protein